MRLFANLILSFVLSGPVAAENMSGPYLVAAAVLESDFDFAGDANAQDEEKEEGRRKRTRRKRNRKIEQLASGTSGHFRQRTERIFANFLRFTRRRRVGTRRTKLFIRTEEQTIDVRL